MTRKYAVSRGLMGIATEREPQTANRKSGRDTSEKTTERRRCLRPFQSFEFERCSCSG